MIIEPKVPSIAVVTYFNGAGEEFEVTDWYFGEFYIVLEHKPSITRILRQSVRKVELKPK